MGNPIIFSFVQDFGQPEGQVTIDGEEFGSDTSVIRVISPDISGFERDLKNVKCTFNKDKTEIVQIQANVPDVWGLQQSSNYQVNTLSMNLGLKVVRDGAESNVEQLVVLIGRPVLGDIKIQGRTLHINNGDKYGGDHYGSIVLYDQDHNPTNDINFGGQLEDSINTSGAGPKLLDSSLAALLHAIRTRGTVADQNLDWHEDQIMVDIPEGFLGGYVVVWRDDIPSVPGQFVPDFCAISEQDIGTLVNWSFVCSCDSAGSTVPVGHPITFGIDCPFILDHTASSLRDQILNQAGNSISWQFLLTDAYGNAVDPKNYYAVVGQPTSSSKHLHSGDLFTLPSLPSGYMYESFELIICPKVYSLENPQYKPQDGYIFKMKAQIHLNCPRDLTVDLGDVFKFTMDPLAIPSMAFFFSEANYNGAPLVVVPSNTMLGGNLSLQGVHYDDNDRSGLPGAMTILLQTLAGLKITLSNLKGFWGITDNELAVIQAAITNIASRSVNIGQLWIFDSTGSLPDLENSVLQNNGWGRNDDDFNDTINSAILIGAGGHGGTCTFDLFVDAHTDGDWSGNRISLAIPPLYLIASIPNFSALHNCDPASAIWADCGNQNFENITSSIYVLGYQMPQLGLMSIILSGGSTKAEIVDYYFNKKVPDPTQVGDTFNAASRDLDYGDYAGATQKFNDFISMVQDFLNNNQGQIPDDDFNEISSLISGAQSIISQIN